MSQSITGIIYFTSQLANAALTDIAFFIEGEAVRHRLGILLGGNLPSWVNEKFANLHHVSLALDGGSLIFNLSETAFYSNCDSLFEPIWIDSTDPASVKVDVSGSSLPRVQRFFEAVFANDAVSHIRLDIETAYDRPENFAHRECAPDRLCETVCEEIAKTGSWRPSVQIVMKRAK